MGMLKVVQALEPIGLCRPRACTHQGPGHGAQKRLRQHMARLQHPGRSSVMSKIEDPVNALNIPIDGFQSIDTQIENSTTVELRCRC